MLASIDVGTNTVRLLLGDVRDGQVIPAKYVRRITRLGGQFSKEKGLSPQAMERTLFALDDLAAELKQSSIASYRMVGTQALRQASNASGFARRILDRTGLNLEIISGTEEARLSSAGVLSVLSLVPASCLIFDIGGGSTEFTLWSGGKLLFFRSYPLGVVRLAEDCAGDGARRLAIGEIVDRFLGDLGDQGLDSVVNDSACSLVGTAGTVTTLAALDLRMTEYDWRRVNNHRMSAGCLAALMVRLVPLDVGLREQMPGMEKGRGDLIVPGLEIVLMLLNRLGKPHLTVSDFGLLEGALLSLASGSAMG